MTMLWVSFQPFVYNVHDLLDCDTCLSTPPKPVYGGFVQRVVNGGTVACAEAPREEAPRDIARGAVLALFPKLIAVNYRAPVR